MAKLNEDMVVIKRELLKDSDHSEKFLTQDIVSTIVPSPKN